MISVDDRLRMRALDAVLFDIDGTLVLNERPLPGAIEAVAAVRAAGLRVRFLTNITSRTAKTLAGQLAELGFDVAVNEVQTATTACVAYLRTLPEARVHLMVPPGVASLFEGIATDDATPDTVVISDLAEGFTFEAMNRAFLMLDRGAELVALSRNMFWFNKQRKQLDAGAFVAALEAATGKTARVMGKPSKDFFNMALAALGTTPDRCLVVGDDILTDIEGARAMGMPAVLVGTGKYRAEHATDPRASGALILSGVDELAARLSVSAV